MIVSIQYLRGLAALLVVFQHVAKKSGQFGGDLFSFFHVGGAGVDIFFIISGFIMCRTTAAGRNGGAGDFLKRRAVRILPLYWVLTLAVLPVFFLAPGLVNVSGGNTRVLESFLLLPTRGNYLIANGWTLSYEFFFYLVFAGGMLLHEKHGRTASAGLLVTLVLLRPVAPADGVFTRFATDPLLLEFVYGMALYALHRRQVLPPGKVAVLLVLAGTGLLCIANNRILTGFRPVDYGLPGLLICAGALGLEPKLRRRRIASFMMLGDSSYSLYLVHPFALSLCGFLFEKSGLLRIGLDRCFIASLAGGSVAAGWLCYFHLEQPLSRLARHWVFGPRGPAPPEVTRTWLPAGPE